MSFDDLEEARSDVYSLQVLNNFYFTNIFHKLDQIFSSLCLLNANEPSTPSSQENDMIVAILNEFNFRETLLMKSLNISRDTIISIIIMRLSHPIKRYQIMCRCLFLPS